MTAALREDTAGVAVAGLPGVGKTTLALKAAHDLVTAGDFAGGTLYLDLHGYDPARRVTPEQALESLLRGLGVPGKRVPPTTAGKVALYRSTLAQESEPMLVVVDNVASVEQAESLTPGVGPHRLLVTSRHRLSEFDGVRLVEVSPMAAGEGCEVIDAVLRTADPDDDRAAREPEAVAELAELCGHLPIALRIVGAHLVTDQGQPPSELVARLHDSGDVVGRLHSGPLDVERLFALSYRYLPEDDALLFRRLALHPGDLISLESAAVLADRTPESARNGMDGLSRAHLVTPDDARGYFRLHDLTRAFARGRGESEESDGEQQGAIDRLLDHYVSTAETAARHFDGHVPSEERPTARFSAREDALRWFDTEHTALIAVVGIAATSPERQARVLPLHESLDLYLSLGGCSRNGLTVARAAVDAARAGSDERAEARALTSLGTFWSDLEELEQARTHLTRALELFDRVDDEYGRIEAVSSLGNACQDPEEAIRHHEEALEKYRELGDRFGEAGALLALGVRQGELSGPDQEVASYEQVFEICRDLGNRTGQAHVLMNIGVIHSQRGEVARAMEHYDRALARYAENGDRSGRARALAYIGIAYYQLGNVEKSKTHLESALPLHAQLGTSDQAQAWSNLGAAYLDLGDHERAVEHLRKGVELHRHTDNPLELGRALGNLATASSDLEEFERAHELLEEALGLFHDLDDRHMLAMTHQGLGRSLVLSEHTSQAFEHVIEALRLWRELGDADGEADALTQLGNFYWRQRKLGKMVKAAWRANKLRQKHRRDSHGGATRTADARDGPAT